jgi:hypothetical protein
MYVRVALSGSCNQCGSWNGEVWPNDVTSTDAWRQCSQSYNCRRCLRPYPGITQDQYNKAFQADRHLAPRTKEEMPR